MMSGLNVTWVSHLNTWLRYWVKNPTSNSATVYGKANFSDNRWTTVMRQKNNEKKIMIGNKI